MMTFGVRLLAWLLMLRLTPLDASRHPYEDLPDNMEVFCPSKTICPERNSSRQFETPNLPSVYKQCCKDCSCDESYGLGTTLPCCYPGDDSPHPRPNQKCLYATSYNKFDIEKHAAFYMTIQSDELVKTKSPIEGLDSNTTTKARSCGQTDVAPWGSLLPVYSEERDRIYKNHLCANEDGVVDAVEWQPYLVCSQFDTGAYREYSLSQFTFIGTDVLTPCYVDFYPLSKIRTSVQRHLCYKDAVKSCSSDYLTLPTPASTTPEEAKQRCESGFFSPYIVPTLGVHANVFCFLCNNGKRNPFYGMCAIDASLQYSGSKKAVATTLLDTSLFVNPKKNDHQLPKQQLACPIDVHDSTSCRPVWCPAGQIYNPAGKCQFPFTWSFFRVKLAVSLTPTRAVSTTLLKDMSESSDVNNLLKSPWGNMWEMRWAFIHDVPYLTSDYSRIFPDILVEIGYKKSSKIRFQNLLTTVEETLRNQWQICLPAGCIPLNQTLAPYSNLGPAQESKTPFWYDVAIKVGDHEQLENITNGTTANLYSLYKGPIIKQSNAIQKTHFCRLVELQDGEYISLYGHSVLFYKTRSFYLFKHEFDLIRKKTGEFVRRICLEDAGFAIKPAASCGRSVFGTASCPYVFELGTFYIACCLMLSVLLFR